MFRGTQMIDLLLPSEARENIEASPYLKILYLVGAMRQCQSQADQATQEISWFVIANKKSRAKHGFFIGLRLLYVNLSRFNLS